MNTNVKYMREKIFGKCYYLQNVCDGKKLTDFYNILHCVPTQEGEARGDWLMVNHNLPQVVLVL